MWSGRGFWCPSAWCPLDGPPGGAAEQERQRLTMRPVFLFEGRNLEFREC